MYKWKNTNLSMLYFAKHMEKGFDGIYVFMLSTLPVMIPTTQQILKEVLSHCVSTVI